VSAGPANHCGDPICSCGLVDAETSEYADRIAGTHVVALELTPASFAELVARVTLLEQALAGTGYMLQSLVTQRSRLTAAGFGGIAAHALIVGDDEDWGEE
jgi:hypothetical protein